MVSGFGRGITAGTALLLMIARRMTPVGGDLVHESRAPDGRPGSFTAQGSIDRPQAKDPGFRLAGLARWLRRVIGL